MEKKLTTAAILFWLLTIPGWQPTVTAKTNPDFTHTKQTPTKRPTGFVENKGQFRDQHGNPNPDVLYIADFGGMKVLLRKDGFSYETYQVKPKWVDPATIPYKILTITDKGDTLESWPGMEEASKILMYHYHRVDVKALGASPAVDVIPEKMVSEISTYIFPEKNGERAEVASYNQVRMNNLVPGVDVLYYADNNGQGFKYDFVIHPHGTLANLVLDYQGAEKIAINGNDFEVSTRFGLLKESIPVCYMEDNKGNRTQVDGIGYCLNENMLGFTGYDHIGNQDKLIIDPAVGFRWAAFFGGEGVDECTGADIDMTGAIYLCGKTTSFTNIATFGSFEDSLKVPQDGFLAKYSESGVLIWSTYLNGHLPNDIVISNSNNPIIANDLGVMKFDSDCNFIWYEELGSPQKAICCDNFDNIVTVGDSILKLNSEGVQVWKRGFGSDCTTFKDVGCDTFGNIFLAGHTTDSSGISTPNSFCQQYNGNNMILTGYDYNFELIGHERQGDGFFIKLDSSGNQLYGSYFGGEYFDIINKISVSDSGLFVIGGETNSRTGIASSGAFQTQLNPQPPYGFIFIAVGFQFPCPPGFWPLIDTCISGGYYVKPYDHRCQSTDSFIALFNANGTRIWSTYYGDYNSEVSTCVNVSNNGDTVAVAGLTTNFNWPAIPYKLASTYTYLKDCGDYPNTHSGVGCGYVAQFNSYGGRTWSSYFPKEDDVTSENLGRWRVSDTRVENNEVIVCGTTNVSGGFAPAFPPNNFINSFASSNIDTIVKPHNSSFCVGDSVVLTVGVITSSPGDLDFIWEKCGVILQGEKDSTIVVHYNEADTGWYCYRIVQGNYSFSDSVHINVSNGNEFDRSDDFIMNHFSSDCKFGDFDGNGELDFALLGSLGNWGQSECLIYRNVSQDFALDAMSVGLRWGSFCVSDFNLDDEIDIIASGSLSGVFGPQTGVTLYYFGDSSGLTLSQVDSNQFYRSSLDYADFDNDGDYDLLITGSQDNGWATAMVKENNDGDLSVHATSFLPIGNGTGLFADFNNDMQIDVLTAGDWGCSDKNCKVFFRSHNAYSLFQTPLQVTGHTCWESAKASAAVGDIDADGDIDFCISGATNPSCCDPLDPKVLVYINNGTIFSLDTMLAAEIGFRTSLGDIDNDGYLDIINGKNVFINSNGSFDLTPTTYGIAHSGLHENISGNYKEVNQSLGDYDNDGDLDFLTAFGLYRNDVCNPPNTPPTAPSGLGEIINIDTVHFSWQRATDLETPQLGLTYNLRVGTTPGGNDIMSSLSDSTGWRKYNQQNEMYSHLKRIVPHTQAIYADHRYYVHAAGARA